MTVSDASQLSLDRELLDAARAGRQRAYAPYSRFSVGAAVRTGSGRIFEGGNVENASYGLTVCAERVALFAAICSGERTVTDIAVVGDVPRPLSPCGACRQVMVELAPRARVIMATTSGESQVTDVAALLPIAFGQSELFEPTP